MKANIEKNPLFPWGFELLNKWLLIKNKGGSLERYFSDNLIHSIAIYGMGEIGKRLYEELKQGGSTVSYAIDRNAANIQIDGLEIRTLDDELPEVDAVVVTPLAFYEIERDLQSVIGKEVNIVFIEDVVEYCSSITRQMR